MKVSTLIRVGIRTSEGCISGSHLEGKTVIVTGANSGIGKETCRGLVLRGARVIMACRDPERGAAAAEEIKSTASSQSGQLVVKQLDLTSLLSVRDFAARIVKDESHLHILVNNAGIMFHPEGRTKDGFEMHFGVNHLSHFLLTLLLLDPLRKAAPSRVINVSSGLHRKGKINFQDINMATKYNPREAYYQSKLANILFTRELAKKLRGTGITTYSLHPGVVNTRLIRHLEERLKPVVWATKLFSKYFLDSPEKGAQTTIYCAVSEALTNVTGKYYRDCKECDPTALAQSDSDAQRLWQLSLDMVGLRKDPTLKLKCHSTENLS